MDGTKEFCEFQKSVSLQGQATSTIMFRITYLESLSESEVWEEDVFLQRVSHLPAVLLGDRLLVDGDGSAVVLYSTHQGVQQSRLTGSYVVETSV